MQSQMSRQSKISRFFTVLLLAFILVSPFIFQQNVFADSSNVVETNFFGNVKDDDNGCGVYTILNLVIDILSIGIILTAVIGVTIVGIKYITAKDSTEQTQKAKSRMLEIVIGLVAYAVLYVGAQFLLPGGHLNGSSCSVVSDEEMAATKTEKQGTTNETNTTQPSASKPKKEETTTIASETCDITKNLKPKSTSGNGYKQTIKLCNKTLKLYKQYQGSYKNQSYMDGTVHGGGCGPTSLAIILSGFGIKKDPGTVAEGVEKIAKSIKKNPKVSPKPMMDYVKSLGLKAKSHNNSASYKTTYNKMRKALLDGHKIVFYVGKGGSGWQKFTSSGYHFISVLGINSKNNKVFVGNSNGHASGWFNLSDVVKARRYPERFWIEVYK